MKKKKLKKTLKQDKKHNLIVISNKLNRSSKKKEEDVQYVQDKGVEKVNELKFKRLNCDIPKELHCWLNLYARSNTSEYKSMTQILIDVLDKFAREHRL